MTAVIIFLNVVLAAAVLTGIVALHGWAITAEQRSTAGATEPSLSFLRLRPRIRVPSVRLARQLVSD